MVGIFLDSLSISLSSPLFICVMTNIYSYFHFWVISGNRDRRKLTFFFKAERRIDFRELVRELFKIYKTRIWMYAVNQAATNSPDSVGEVENEGVSSTSVSTATTAPTATPTLIPPEASVHLQQHLPNDQAKRSYHQPQSYMSPTQTRPDFRGMSTPFAGMQQDQGYSHHPFVHSVGING